MCIADNVQSFRRLKALQKHAAIEDPFLGVFPVARSLHMYQNEWELKSLQGVSIVLSYHRRKSLLVGNNSCITENEYSGWWQI